MDVTDATEASLAQGQAKQDATIKVDTDELNKLAAKFKALSSKSTDISSKLNGIVSTIDANWDGSAADAFNGKYNNWKSTITRYTTNLNSAATELSKAVSTLKSADES